MELIRTIALPTRPQPDTIVAIFLLKTFGREHFPGIETASVDIRPTLAPGDTFESLCAEGVLSLDVGGGPLDHHNKNLCASELVAQFLSIEKDPSLGQLLTYARRDDKDGKGTISKDALDRAFGLSGLIAACNKIFPRDPNHVVQATLPLLEAHYLAAKEHYVELPQEVAEKKAEGLYEECYVEHAGKKIKVACIISDKPSMPTFLRSRQGASAEVVLQKLEKTNHYSILSRQDKDIDLSGVAGLIRLREMQLLGIEENGDTSYLTQTGRIVEIPHWYFDPATKSVLNGGIHNKTVQASAIRWEEMKHIVQGGLQLPLRKQAPATSTNTKAPAQQLPSYYLSIEIPHAIGKEVVDSIDASSDVKVHAAENLHITLEYFGQKNKKEVEEIVRGVTEGLANTEAFTLHLDNKQLTSGSPEGYNHAWYLALDDDSGAIPVRRMMADVLPALTLPAREKMLHVTVAVPRKKDSAVPEDAVTIKSAFDATVPVNEIVLMESAFENGKRVYRPHTTFSLVE